MATSSTCVLIVLQMKIGVSWKVLSDLPWRRKMKLSQKTHLGATYSKRRMETWICFMMYTNKKWMMSKQKEQADSNYYCIHLCNKGEERGVW
jgi:hypothetical protein